MNILTRMCISLDGYVTTPQGWPVQLADPNFSPLESERALPGGLVELVYAVSR